MRAPKRKVGIRFIISGKVEYDTGSLVDESGMNLINIILMMGENFLLANHPMPKRVTQAR